MTERELINSLTDEQVVALTIFGEIRGGSLEAMRAVADVIRNRVRAGRFGNGWTEVCLAPWQFSCWKPEGGAANYDSVMKAARAIVGPNPPALIGRCYAIAVETIVGARPDSVLGATHYLTEALFADPLKCPKWARRLTPTVAIGDHLFFRNGPVQG